MCLGCYNDTHWTCDDCGAVYCDDDSPYTDDDGQTLCETCYRAEHTECDRCGDWTRRDDVFYCADGNDVCRLCYDRHYFTCDNCDQVLRDEGYAGDGLCQDCYDADDDADDDGECNCGLCRSSRESYGAPAGTIHNYDFKPRPRMFGRAHDGVRFGVEIEVGVRRHHDTYDKAKEVAKLIGVDFAYLKYDGSIREDASLDGGFEIATHPADLATHRERFGRLLAARIPGLVSWNTSSCGMHVHATRNGMSDWAIGKLAVFINNPKHKDFIHHVAGRMSSRWAALDPSKTLKSGRVREMNRYQALNLCNTNTVEFRIFKGSLKFETVMKNVEFCHAAIDFVKNNPPRCLNVNAFIEWVGRTPRQWPNLTRWLRDCHYLTPVKAKPGSVVLVEADV